MSSIATVRTEAGSASVPIKRNCVKSGSLKDNKRIKLL